MNINPHPFEKLTPDFIMDAVDAAGYLCDGRLFALNSYENRVYQVGVEDAEPLIAKFYRPQRWSDEQILEEHEFCFELVDHELPVVAPLKAKNGSSLFNFGGFCFALYPRRGGRNLELDNLDSLHAMGKMLGRIHLVGASRPFKYRPVLDSKTFGHQSVELISQHFIPSELQLAYDTLAADVLQQIDQILQQVEGVEYIRLHGDCHSGNVLWRDGPHFVDFDDARMAPAVQDIWMLLSGDRPSQSRQLSEIIGGYSEFYNFRTIELRLVEVLRTLRIMHYSAWLARRWEDPAFPHNFPWFNTMRYWSEHILELREQFAALHEEPLQLY